MACVNDENRVRGSTAMMTFSAEDPRDWYNKTIHPTMKLIECKGFSNGGQCLIQNASWFFSATIVALAWSSLQHSWRKLVVDIISCIVLQSAIEGWAGICLLPSPWCTMRDVLSKGQSTINTINNAIIDCWMLHVASLNLFSILFQSHKKWWGH